MRFAQSKSRPALRSAKPGARFMARWASRGYASAMVGNVRGRVARKCSAPLVTSELAHHGLSLLSRRHGNRLVCLVTAG